jgi:tripartite-type tricarboxylate transporter receptor subunit TctC
MKRQQEKRIKFSGPRFLRVFSILIACVSLCLICTQTIVAKDKYPQKPIDIIVPSSVGGGTDIWMRTFAVALASKKNLRTPVNIRTMPGGATLRGAGVAIKAKPDGYTLFACNPPSTPWAWYVHQPPFDIRKFVGICVYIREPAVIAVPSNSVYKDYKSLANVYDTGELKIIGSLQPGQLYHITSLLLKKRDILNWKTYVSYQGCGDVVAALLRKEIPCGLCTSTSMLNATQDGKIHAIAIVGREGRLESYSDAPSLRELGKSPLLETTLCRTVFAPPGLPKEIQKILEEAFIKAQDDPIMQSRYKSLSLEPARGNGIEAEKVVLESIKVAEELELRKIMTK